MSPFSDIDDQIARQCNYDKKKIKKVKRKIKELESNRSKHYEEQVLEDYIEHYDYEYIKRPFLDCILRWWYRRQLKQSLGPAPPAKMVSRRDILTRGGSRGRDNEPPYMEDDVYNSIDGLLHCHIQEVLQKWKQIDDEIWAKVIVFERNRRVAKAYVRSPILTINGSDNGFDGFRIGLDGFENPRRDQETTDVITKQIGQGIKLRMDDAGKIQIKKVSRAPVYIKAMGEENSINPHLLRPNTSLETDRPELVFDMAKFEDNFDTEMEKNYPDMKKLESQCIFGIVFGQYQRNLLQCPSWVMIINVVAMELLQNKAPVQIPPAIPNLSMRDRPRQPPPSEEDIYSMTTTTSSSGPPSSGFIGSNKDKKDSPPRLPPRDVRNGGSKSVFRHFNRKNNNNNNNNNGQRRKDLHDDPYYSGLSARPTFNQQARSTKDRHHPDPRLGHYPNMYLPHHNYQRAMFPTRSFDSGMESDMNESAYSHIYGRLPLPNRGYMAASPPQPPMYGRDWE